MIQLQFYRALNKAKEELKFLSEAYAVTHKALAFMSERRQGRYEINCELYDAHESWESENASIYGKKFTRELDSRLRELIGTISSFRRELRQDPIDSFEKRCSDVLRNLRMAGSDAFTMNEGRQFDFSIHVGFKERGVDTGEEAYEWSYTTYESGGYWHGNNRIAIHAVSMNLTPAYLKKVHEHFRFFMNGKNKCWVLSTEELNNHALNDLGYRVFRAACFGLLPDDSQPKDYPMYIIDSPDYKGEDGQVLFAHGATVNAAHNLLKRRIKSETLKRLSI